MITSYKDLTVSKYLELERIALEIPDDTERNTAVLSVLTGISPDRLLAMPIADYREKNRKAAFLLTPPKPYDRARQSYKCGPFELVPVRNYAKVTTAQYIDFQSFIKRFPDDSQGIQFILSCFMVPAGHTYCDGYDPAEVQDAIREHMSVVDALSLHRFFFHLFVKSTARTLTSLIRATERLERMATKTLEATDSIRAREKAVELKTKAETLRSIAAGDGLQTWTPFRRLSALVGIQSGE